MGKEQKQGKRSEENTITVGKAPDKRFQKLNVCLELPGERQSMPGQEKAEQKADKETENQSWIFPQEPQVPKCGMQ